MIALKEKMKSLKEKLSKPILIIAISAFFAVLPTKFAGAMGFFDMFAWIGGFGAKGVTAILLAFLWPVLLFFNTLLGTILYISGFLFNWALELSMERAPFVEIGWTISLQFANMFFIIILLAIAISIILGVGEQSLGKKALPKLLVIALLINFSMAIGNIIIDATNVFARFFSNTISGSSLDVAEKIMYAIQLNSSKFADQSLLSQLGNAVANMSNIFGIFIYQIIFQVVAIFMMLAGTVYMVTRAFYLWLLLMLAPLAWIAMIIPGQKKHWDTWWSKLISWSLFAPVFLFFTYLALVIAGTDFTAMVTNADGIKLGGTKSGTDFFNAGALIKLAITAFLMTAGIVAGQKMGVGGSNFVLSAGKSFQGAATKKFKDMRGKSEWSAEAVGKKFGAIGARMAAPFGVTERGKRIQERFAVEKLEAEEKERKKEQVGGLYNLRGRLENTKRLERESLAFATEAGLSKEQLKEYREQLRNRKLQILRDIRAAAGEGKDLKKEIEKLAKEAGVIEEPTEKKEKKEKEEKK